MSITLYGSSHSRSFRVLWMLEEMGLPYEHQPIPFQTCAQDPAYVALNPAGSIPCITDNGLVLSESLAINLHLSAKPGALAPLAPTDQAKAMQWSLWAATSLEPEAMRWSLHSVWMPEAYRDAAQAADALAQLQRPLTRLAVGLEHSSHLLGDHFTVADLNVAVMLTLLSDAIAPSHPTVHAWLQRCVSRPAHAEAESKA